MKKSYAGHVAPSNIAQTEKLDDRQVANNGGGFGYAVDDSVRLERFLILGSESNTFYQSAGALTRENAQAVERMWMKHPAMTAAVIASISTSGRAPKNDPAIFAVALGTISENVEARQLAFSIVSKVCRTGTHIMQLVALCKELGRGFGRGMKRAVANWYLEKPVENLAYQLVKYRSRNGYTHERLLDMARPKPDSDQRNALFAWATGKLPIDGDVARPADFPEIIVAHERAMMTTGVKELVPIVLANKNLPWEALPTWANSDPLIQGELLPYMGMTALVRNLGNLTRIGVITSLSTAEDLVCDRLRNATEIKDSRVHPMQILIALKVYASGKGLVHGGKTPPTWTPSRRIVDALNDAFYLAFHNVAPTGKRYMVAIDVSGSMGNAVTGCPVLSCCEAAAAMSLVLAKTEERTWLTRFNNGLEQVNYGPNSRMDDILRQTRSINIGGTDCAMPMLAAMQHEAPVDVFIVITDNETNARSMHPMEALRQYRKKMGINAKLVVMAMTSSRFTIADPDDAGALDVVGFDAGVPAIIADFAKH